MDEELDALLVQPVALALDGPKGVGKTATAMQRTSKVYALDDSRVRQLVEADPEAAMTSAAVVCFDEWQHAPWIWDLVRRAVDARSAISYLLTGSASPHGDADTHSGAGRILTMRLRPMSLPERGVTQPTVLLDRLLAGDARIEGQSTWGLSNYSEAICASGFPGIHELPDRLRRAQLDGYLARVIDRDLPEMGVAQRRPDSLRRWLTAYAAASSTTASYTAILDAVAAGESDKPARSTTGAYRDLLTKIWILDPVPVWQPTGTELSRLKRAEKHQLADPALAARLLNHTPATLMAPRPGSAELLGQLFESLAALTVRAAAQACEATVGHLRTRDGGHEIDLIVERYNGQVVALEVKLSSMINDSDVRHLHWLGNQLGPRLVDKVLVTTGTHAYRRPDGVAVVPLALLG